MDTPPTLEETTEILQQLGLKEYEARCFVGLCRIDSATAKQLSELTEVPRTRVYDAVRVLSARDLVEIHHSSPQKFRAVPIEEALETLKDRYEDRFDRLRNALTAVDTVDSPEQPDQEVWALAGSDAVEHRTRQLVAGAGDEVVLLVGHGSPLTDELGESLDEIDPDVDVLVGALSASLQEDIRSIVPDGTAIVSPPDWLRSPEPGEHDPGVGRLLMVDRSSVMLSSIGGGLGEEQAVFGEGPGNALVVVASRFVTGGLRSEIDVRT